MIRTSIQETKTRPRGLGSGREFGGASLVREFGIRLDLQFSWKQKAENRI